MKVLIVGRHPGLLANLVGQVEALGINAQGCTQDEEARAALESGEFDAIAVGGGVEDESRRLIHAWAASSQPTAKVLDIFGPQTLVPRLRELLARESPGD